MEWPSGIDGYMLAYAHDPRGHPRTNVELEDGGGVLYSSSALELFNKGEKVNMVVSGLWGCTCKLVSSSGSRFAC